MPSAPQNRFWANGRSFDTFTTDTPLPAARSLNFRTLVAHTGVSTDGKMFSHTDLPLNCSLVTAPRSAPVRLNAGAGDPTAGSSPTVLIGFPRKVICAMGTVCQARQTGLGSGLRSTVWPRVVRACHAVATPLYIWSTCARDQSTEHHVDNGAGGADSREAPPRSLASPLSPRHTGGSGSAAGGAG